MIVPSGVEAKDVLGGTFGRERLLRGFRGTKGVVKWLSPRYSSWDESDIDVASTCSTVEVSDSEESSDAVDGSYSCFNGDEERLGVY